MQIKNFLADAITRLNPDEGAFEAQLLLQHLLNVNRAWLITHQNDALEANIHTVYRALINRRVNGEPIAYILGHREFYGLKLKVSPDTLIPREDTEILVDASLAKIPQSDISHSPSFPRRRESMLNLNQKMDSRLRGNDELSVLDLGTGSGAIALSIAKHRPQTLVTAIDASQAALDIAIENAQNLNIANVKFLLSDWFSHLKGQKFDLIVSNPPYIETSDSHLKQGDLRSEPISALVSGMDGLDAIRSIINQAPLHLSPHGWLLLEHGHNQAEAVATLLKNSEFVEIETIKDLGGNERVTLGKILDCHSE